MSFEQTFVDKINKQYEEVIRILDDDQPMSMVQRWYNADELYCKTEGEYYRYLNITMMSVVWTNDPMSAARLAARTRLREYRQMLLTMKRSVHYPATGTTTT